MPFVNAIYRVDSKYRVKLKKLLKITKRQEKNLVKV